MSRILPHQKAPVIVNKGKGPEVCFMNFSLIPAWSKEKRPKFATHNARLDSLTTKPTWKSSFLEKRCLIPISNFIEPIYSGSYAGNMVEFHQKDHNILSAAGLWSEWTDKETGEVIESFAVITSDPSPYVKEIGHDRQPLFLKEAAFDRWLTPNKRTANELLQILIEERDIPAFDVTIDRPLRPGWEKRK